jgi:hypothetical protein
MYWSRPKNSPEICVLADSSSNSSPEYIFDKAREKKIVDIKKWKSQTVGDYFQHAGTKLGQISNHHRLPQIRIN